MFVEVTTQCKCQCETLIADDRCMNRGDLVCGACHCYKGYYGDNCNCSDGTVDDPVFLDQCRPKDRETLQKTFKTNAISSITDLQRVT